MNTGHWPAAKLASRRQLSFSRCPTTVRPAGLMKKNRFEKGAEEPAARGRGAPLRMAGRHFCDKALAGAAVAGFN